MQLKSVRYKLDGKRLKRVKKLKFGAKLRPAKLTAGKHVVTVRVTPKVGKAKIVQAPPAPGRRVSIVIRPAGKPAGRTTLASHVIRAPRGR